MVNSCDDNLGRSGRDTPHGALSHAAFTPAEKERAIASVREKYSKVANSPERLFTYPVGLAGMEGLGYDPALTSRLPGAASSRFCGVGNLFSLGRIEKGHHILDIGCGAGADSLIAAMMTGPEGRVTGIDISPEMLDRARQNARHAGAANVTFMEGSADRLDFADRSFDVVISNGAFNLVVDKDSAAREIFRALKPGGSLMIADQILTGEPPAGKEAMIKSWGR